MNKRPLRKISQNALKRRFTVALAGAGSGARLLGSHAGSVFKNEDERSAIRSKALAQEAEKFSRKLGELKGAYVKIGQMMAMYGEHLLPAEVTQALRELEDKTTAMDWTVIQPLIDQELGDTGTGLEIQSEALAAASLSQVHRAKITETGKDVCLKVQYPGIANTIESDFNTVLQMLRFARWLPNGKEFEAWMQEIKALLLDEVDYHREARMSAKVAALIADDQRFVVPTVHRRLSSNTILTMDYEAGYVVSHPKVAKLSLQRRNALASAMIENFFDEVFTWGLMQTDPNFGNYRIQLRGDKFQVDKLVLLDFGALRELPKKFQQSLQQTIVAAHQQDRSGVIAGAVKLGCLQAKQTSSVKESFADFCILLMEPFRPDHSQTPGFALNAKGHYDWSRSRLIKRVGKAGAMAILAEGFTSPPKEFALIARKLTGVFTFITALNAEFNAAPLLARHI